MSDPAVIDWDRIIHKNVRSKDMQGAGNVVAIDADSVIISTQGAQHQYKIPKSHVEGYNGAEVFLDIAVSEMSSFNTDNDNNVKAQTHRKDAGTLSSVESSLPPVTITKTSSQTSMIQGQEVQSKKEEGKEASEVSKQQYIKKEKVLANGIKQESAKVPIPSTATKTITTTTNITSSRTHSYNNNKPEKTQQGAITTTAGLTGQRVNNDTMQKEQGLGKKEETISSIRDGGPVKSEVTVRPTQSITTTTANKTSTLSSKPTTETQSKNDMPAPPQSSSLTTKTLAELPEKIISEESEGVEVEKALTRAETEASSSSMTDNAKIQQQNQQKIENEVPTTTSTIQRQENIQPEVEVTIKPPNNIEFNPPISAESVSTAIEVGIDGSNAVDDIRGPEEKEKEQQYQHAFHEEKIDNDNKYPINNLTPFAIGIALWQQSMVHWIDIYNEFATNTAQVTQYWFNAFKNTRIGIEQKNSEKIKGE
jgi:hypothetical protein